MEYVCWQEVYNIIIIIQCTCPFIQISICLSVYPSICLSVCLSLCLSNPSIHPSTHKPFYANEINELSFVTYSSSPVNPLASLTVVRWAETNNLSIWPINDWLSYFSQLNWVHRYSGWQNEGIKINETR